jgi:6,7-dimethyl-8-ribityllumazine synthase
MSGSFSEVSITTVPDGRWGAVASLFHRPIVDRLLAGALEVWEQAGIGGDRIEVIRVPGVWEVPLGLEWLLSKPNMRGLVALGLVLRGETEHDRWILQGTVSAVQSLALQHRVPIGFGILTCENLAQAEARAGGSVGHRGREAAWASLHMASLGLMFGGGVRS